MPRKKPHPWNDWFRRRQLVLRRGVHYTCMPHSMGQQVRNAAFQRNLKVSVKIAGDVLVITNWDWVSG